MNRLESLTLIVPTLNRHEAIARTMAYWSNRGPRIVVLDGSVDPVEELVLRSMGSNVQYVHGERDILARLGMVQELVATDFACLHGDDELHLPSALNASVQFLVDTPKAASCMGWALGFEVSADGRVLARDKYPALRGYRIDADSPMRRVRQHLSPYRVPAQVYAVAHTPFLVRALATSLANPSRNFFAQAELEYEISMAAQGQFYSLPRLHWLRRAEPSELRGTDVDTDATKRFTKFWSDPVRESDVEAFVDNLADSVAALASESSPRMKRELIQIFDEHCSMLIAREQVALGGSFKRMLRSFPPPVWALLRRTRSALRNVGPGPHLPTLMAGAENLRLLGMEFDIEELREATRYLTSFNGKYLP